MVYEMFCYLVTLRPRKVRASGVEVFSISRLFESVYTRIPVLRNVIEVLPGGVRRSIFGGAVGKLLTLFLPPFCPQLWSFEPERRSLSLRRVHFHSGWDLLPVLRPWVKRPFGRAQEKLGFC